MGRAIFEDLTGRQYNRFTVLGINRDKSYIRWLCKCLCGNERYLSTVEIKQRAISCGCHMKLRFFKLNSTTVLALTSIGKHFVFDFKDFESVSKYNWTVLPTGYIKTVIDNKSVTLSRYIMNPPESLKVDHKNGHKLNNKRTNLRIATSQQNAFNVRKSKHPKLSKYKGVTLKNSKWIARITHNKKLIHLGCYATEKEAGLAYNVKAIELFGEFAHLNNIK